MQLKVCGNLPCQAHPGDAGLDLCYDPNAQETLVLRPGHRLLIPTGMKIELPEGYAGLVLPRSGLASTLGVTVLNAPGLIDSGYRGDVGVILIHHGDHPVGFQPGERIAQLVIVKVEEVELELVQELSETERGEGGFGSTGAASRNLTRLEPLPGEVEALTTPQPTGRRRQPVSTEKPTQRRNSK